MTASGFSIGALALPSPTEDECAGVAWIVNDLHHAAVQQLAPDQLALVRTAADTTREGELLGAKDLHRAKARARSLELRKEEANRLLHLRIGIEDDRSVAS